MNRMDRLATRVLVLEARVAALEAAPCETCGGSGIDTSLSHPAHGVEPRPCPDCTKEPTP